MYTIGEPSTPFISLSPLSSSLSLSLSFSLSLTHSLTLSLPPSPHHLLNISGILHSAMNWNLRMNTSIIRIRMSRPCSNYNLHYSWSYYLHTCSNPMFKQIFTINFVLASTCTMLMPVNRQDVHVHVLDTWKFTFWDFHNIVSECTIACIYMYMQRMTTFTRKLRRS